MKKYLLVNLTILFAAAFLWAADEAAIVREGDLDIKASGTVSWGVDRGIKHGITDDKDTEARHGFKNEASWEVKFPIIKKGNRTSRGGAAEDARVYGEVILKDIEMGIQSKNDKKDFAVDGKVDGLKATLYFYDFSLSVFDKPGFKSNYAQIWDPRDTNDFKNGPYKFEPGFDGYGVRFGYANPHLMGLDVGVKLGSNGDWEAEGKAGEPDFDKPSKILTIKANESVPDDKVCYALPNGNLVSGKVTADTTVIAYARKGKQSGRHSKYAVGVDFSIKPLGDLLAIAFNANATLAKAKDYDGNTKLAQDDNILGFGVEVTSTPIEALKLKFALDGGAMYLTGNYKDNKQLKSLAVDSLVSAEYKWVAGGVYIASPATTALVDPNKPGEVPNALSGVSRKAYKDNKFDKLEMTDLSFFVKFETKAKEDDPSHLVKGLDAGAFIGMYRLMTFANRNTDDKLQKKETIPLLMKVWGAYTLNLSDSSTIKPFADIWAETNHLNKNGDDYVLGLAYDLGVEYVPVEKVTVTAKWEHGKINKNLYATKVDGAVISNGLLDYKSHKGKFVLSLKVAY